MTEILCIKFLTKTSAGCASVLIFCKAKRATSAWQTVIHWTYVASLKAFLIGLKIIGIPFTPSVYK